MQADMGGAAAARESDGLDDLEQALAKMRIKAANGEGTGFETSTSLAADFTNIDPALTKRLKNDKKRIDDLETANASLESGYASHKQRADHFEALASQQATSISVLESEKKTLNEKNMLLKSRVRTQDMRLEELGFTGSAEAHVASSVIHVPPPERDFLAPYMVYGGKLEGAPDEGPSAVSTANGAAPVGPAAAAAMAAPAEVATTPQVDVDPMLIEQSSPVEQSRYAASPMRAAAPATETVHTPTIRGGGGVDAPTSFGAGSSPFAAGTPSAGGKSGGSRSAASPMRAAAPATETVHTPTSRGGGGVSAPTSFGAGSSPFAAGTPPAGGKSGGSRSAQRKMRRHSAAKLLHGSP